MVSDCHETSTSEVLAAFGRAMEQRAAAQRAPLAAIHRAIDSLAQSLDTPADSSELVALVERLLVEAARTATDRERRLTEDVDRLNRQVAQHAEERAMAESALTRATEQLQSAEVSLASMRRAIDRITQERDETVNQLRRQEEETSRLAHDAEQARARMEHLDAAFGQLSGVGSVRDLLTATLHALKDEWGRVALFEPCDEHLQLTGGVGLDGGHGPEATGLQLAIESPLAAGFADNRIRILTMDEAAGTMATPFAGDPQHMLLMPLSSHGRPVALIYGDDAGHPLQDSQTLSRLHVTADLLGRHVGARLDALTRQSEAPNELRAYAALLLEEMEYRYGVAARAGVASEHTRRELREDLDRARSLYAQRAENDGEPSMGFFDLALADTVCARASTSFGDALASVASDSMPGQESAAGAGRGPEKTA